MAGSFIDSAISNDTFPIWINRSEGSSVILVMASASSSMFPFENMKWLSFSLRSSFTKGRSEAMTGSEERDGIFYPVLVAGTEQTDIEAGRYGRMWIKYIKEEYPMRYKSLVRFGELEDRADEVNETAYELLDDIEAKWLKKHKPSLTFIHLI